MRGALRSLSQEGFWVLFDLMFFVASLGLGVPMHVLAQTSQPTRMSCKLAQGAQEGAASSRLDPPFVCLLFRRILLADQSAGVVPVCAVHRRETGLG